MNVMQMTDFCRNLHRSQAYTSAFFPTLKYEIKTTWSFETRKFLVLKYLSLFNTSLHLLSGPVLSNGVVWVTVLIKDLDRKSRDKQRSGVIMTVRYGFSKGRYVFYSTSFRIQTDIEEIIMARLWLVRTGGNTQEVVM